jgi:hypothetical protein
MENAIMIKGHGRMLSINLEHVSAIQFQNETLSFYLTGRPEPMTLTKEESADFLKITRSNIFQHFKASSSS